MRIRSFILFVGFAAAGACQSPEEAVESVDAALVKLCQEKGGHCAKAGLECRPFKDLRGVSCVKKAVLKDPYKQDKKKKTPVCEEENPCDCKSVKCDPSQICEAKGSLALCYTPVDGESVALPGDTKGMPVAEPTDPEGEMAPEMTPAASSECPEGNAAKVAAGEKAPACECKLGSPMTSTCGKGCSTTCTGGKVCGIAQGATAATCIDKPAAPAPAATATPEGKAPVAAPATDPNAKPSELDWECSTVATLEPSTAADAEEKAMMESAIKDCKKCEADAACSKKCTYTWADEDAKTPAKVACTQAGAAAPMTPAAPATPGAAPAGNYQGDGVGYAKDVKPIFANKCATCHSAGGSGASAHTLAEDFDGATDPAKNAECAGKTKGECTVIRIKSGSMPAGKACKPFPADNSSLKGCPTPSEIKVLEAWVAGGLKP